jgi:hypothetical protein
MTGSSSRSRQIDRDLGVDAQGALVEIEGHHHNDAHARARWISQPSAVEQGWLTVGYCGIVVHSYCETVVMCHDEEHHRRRA